VRWPPNIASCALLGALLGFGKVLLTYLGDYEGADSIFVLGPVTAMLGGLAGAAVGSLLNRG